MCKFFRSHFLILQYNSFIMDPKTEKVLKHIEELEAKIKKLQDKDQDVFSDLAPLVEKIIEAIKHPD